MHYIAKEVALDLSYIEQTLTERAYFAGYHFTASDIMMTIILEIADNLTLLEYKEKTKSYLEKVKSRKAYQLANNHG
jgi:glutathione S-transferase